jgi:hypothetical protein
MATAENRAYILNKGRLFKNTMFEQLELALCVRLICRRRLRLLEYSFGAESQHYRQSMRAFPHMGGTMRLQSIQALPKIKL